MSSELHKKIAELFVASVAARYLVLLDKDCGGDQRIPLFVGPEKHNSTEYCDVDLLVLLGDKVRCIVEIEESDIKPTQICGKFLTSALAEVYEHLRHGRFPLNSTNGIHFVQVVDSSGLKEKTSKRRQFLNLEQSIRELLPLGRSSIKDYHIFEISGTSDELGLKRLTSWIEASLGAEDASC